MFSCRRVEVEFARIPRLSAKGILVNSTTSHSSENYGFQSGSGLFSIDGCRPCHSGLIAVRASTVLRTRDRFRIGP